MLLYELFADPPLDIKDAVRDRVLDILTPLVAQKVPFVTVQQLIDKLRDLRTGVALDRGFLMDILDPDSIKAVDKIEGDRIYLNTGGSPDRNVKDDDKKKEQEKISKNAMKQAKKDVSDKDSPL